MPQPTRSRGLWWSRFHFLMRFLGLTGLLICIVAVTLAWRRDILTGWPALWPWDQVEQAARQSAREIQTTVEKADWDFARIVVTALLAGAALAVLALLVEFLAGIAVVSGRRSAFGFNAFVQVVLAALLLIAINYYSFGHYLRFDWTQDRQFTLPKEISDQLRQLQGETHIIVYQRHKTLGQVADKPDDYDVAAERKVLDKIEDLVDLFREFGPRFRVETLDVAKENFSDRLDAVTHQIAEKSLREQKEDPDYRPKADEINRKAKELRVAIESAPEDSIFFFGGGKMQALSFNDLVQLDKAASQEQDNLVMLDQGVKPFADKVLNVEAKKPKIGIALIHEYLSSEGWEDYGLAGLKKSLESRGFDVQEIILKRWSQFAPPEPGVYTVEESKLDRLEERLFILDLNIKNLERAIKQLTELRREWRSASLADLVKKYGDELGVKKLTEEDRTEQLDAMESALAYRQTQLDEQHKRRTETLDEKNKLNVDQLAEQRRLSDLQGKLSRLLADCDLLIVPRMTLRNVNTGELISPRVYRLDDVQVNAIKDFIKSGKPLLACFGPTNESQDRPPSLEGSGPDALEDLLGKLGIKFGKQTVLFDQELESFAERRVNTFATGANVKVPPVTFDWKPGEGVPQKFRAQAVGEKSNRLHESLSVTAHSLGKGKDGKNWLFDLRPRHPRPVYFVSPDGKKPATDPVFLMTSADSWNEDQPFPTRDRIPQFEQPKANDPDKGTLDEKRRGPFPIGVAVETTVPADWYGSSSRPATVRIAAIGHGGFFTGSDKLLEREPAKEKVMLDTINWLLGRDEYLPKADRRWSYPRVRLEERDQQLWHWGTQLALPGLFAWLGLVVLLVRRVR